MSLQVWLPLNKATITNAGLTNVTTSNLTYVSTGGKFGGCFATNGEVCNWGIGHVSNGVSVCFWHKWKNGPTTDNVIVAHFPFSGTDKRYYLYSSGQKFYIGYGVSTAYAKSTNDENWHHIALCCSEDGNSLTLYIDGVLEATKTNNGGFTFDHNFSINSNSLISDFRIYDHTLSHKEVIELSKGLMLNYKLESDQIETVTNLSPISSRGGWNNSGVAERTFGGTTIPNTPYGMDAYCIKQTTAGDQCITYGGINCSPSTTYACSCYVYVSSTFTPNTTFYIRSVANNNKAGDNVGSLEYNGSANISTWPKEQWIRVSKVVTTADNETGIYFCKYVDTLNELNGVCAWQIEKRDHVTDYTSSTRNGVCYDVSGFGNDGTVGGSFVIDNDRPVYTKSTVFNGTDTYIQGQYYHGKQTTFNLWMKGTATRCHLIDCRTNSVGAQPFYLQGGGTSIQGGGSGAFPTLSAGKSIIDNEWHMLTEVYDNTKLSLYVDGSFASSATCAGTEYGLSPVYLGRRYTTSYWYTGKVSDLRIYATALDADYIKGLYQTKGAIDKDGNMFISELIQKDGSRELMRPLSEINSRNTAVYNYNDGVTITSKDWAWNNGEYIEINPTNKTYYYDLTYSMNTQSSTFYVGFEVFDANKTSTSNSSCRYILSSSNVADHVRIKGTVNLATDDAGTTAKYIRLRILTDWYSNSTSTISTIHSLSLREVSNLSTGCLDKEGCMNAISFKNDDNKSRIYKNGFVSANEFYEK